jgi:Protein of unknown function (DUF1488)
MEISRPLAITGILMPIFRDREQFEFQRFEGLYFWMRDCADQFLCKVSDEALRVRNRLDGGDGDLVATFVRHRVRIEMVAGKKYDESHRKNGLILVLSKDLRGSRNDGSALTESLGG